MAVVHISGGRIERPSDSTQEQQLPQELANDRFVFVHYPLAWTFDIEHGFIPDLCQIPETPGVNGVGRERNTSRAIGSATGKKGGVVIHGTDSRLGEWKPYLASYPCEGGRRHYCFRGTEFDSLGNGQVAAVPDHVGYRRFLAHLVSAGVVDMISPPAYNILRRRAEDRLTRLVGRSADSPSMQAAVEVQSALIKAMATAWAKVLAGPATADVEVKRTRIGGAKPEATA
jgi:hypothetical protein